MNLALVVGFLGGLAVVLVAGALRPARPPLALVIDHLGRPGPATAAVPGRLGGRLARRLEDSTLAAALCRAAPADLRIVGLTAGELGLRRLTWAAAAGTAGPAVGAFASVLGVGVPVVVPAGVALVFAVLGAVAPGVVLRSRARARRVEFSWALAGFVNLVSAGLAAGQGVPEALETSAAMGDGWAFAELRRTIGVAELHNQAPWDAFEALGAALGVPELRQVAASLTLAGEDGAQVTASIGAKARDMRDAAGTRIEADANAASELMSVPLMAMLMALVVFLGYPAAQAILGGLGPS